MQVAGNYFLDRREKTYTRKLKEVLLAFNLEREAQQTRDTRTLSQQDFPRPKSLWIFSCRIGLLQQDIDRIEPC